MHDDAITKILLSAEHMMLPGDIRAFPRGMFYGTQCNDFSSERMLGAYRSEIIYYLI